jgi:hypothetical protein
MPLKDLVVGRDWVEATRLAEETAASGDGILGLRTSVQDPLSFKRSTQFVDIDRDSWRMEMENNHVQFWDNSQNA